MLSSNPLFPSSDIRRAAQTGSYMDRWEWHEQELARSPRFRDEIDEARVGAFAARRSSDVLASYASLDMIQDAVQRARNAPRDEHRYRWREARVDREGLAA